MKDLINPQEFYEIQKQLAEAKAGLKKYYKLYGKVNTEIDKLKKQLDADAIRCSREIDELNLQLGRVCYALQQNSIAIVLTGDDVSHANYKEIRLNRRRLDNQRRELCAKISAVIGD